MTTLYLVLFFSQAFCFYLSDLTVILLKISLSIQKQSEKNFYISPTTKSTNPPVYICALPFLLSQWSGHPSTEPLGFIFFLLTFRRESAPEFSLWLFSLSTLLTYSFSLGNLTQFYGFKYHQYATDSKIVSPVLAYALNSTTFHLHCHCFSSSHLHILPGLLHQPPALIFATPFHHSLYSNQSDIFKA